MTCIDFETFQTNVDAGCGNTPYQMFAAIKLEKSGASIADPLMWAYRVICIQDE